MVEETLREGYSTDFGCFFPSEGGIGVAIPSRGKARSGLSVAVTVHGEISAPDTLARLAERVSGIFAEMNIRV